jgi:hypothetical protein
MYTTTIQCKKKHTSPPHKNENRYTVYSHKNVYTFQTRKNPKETGRRETSTYNYYSQTNIREPFICV